MGEYSRDGNNAEGTTKDKVNILRGSSGEGELKENEKELVEKQRESEVLEAKGSKMEENIGTQVPHTTEFTELCTENRAIHSTRATGHLCKTHESSLGQLGQTDGRVSDIFWVKTTG